jgi:hypothetical protein
VRAKKIKIVRIMIQVKLDRWLDITSTFCERHLKAMKWILYFFLLACFCAGCASYKVSGEKELRSNSNLIHHSACRFPESRLRELEKPDLRFPYNPSSEYTNCFGGSSEVKLKSSLNVISHVLGYSYFFAPVRVNGRQACLCVDLGAFYTSLNPEFAYECRIPIVPFTNSSLGSLPLLFPGCQARITPAIVTNFNIGKLFGRDIVVIVPNYQVNIKWWRWRLVKVDGLLGRNVLANFAVTFDFTRHCVILKPVQYNSLPTARSIPFRMESSGPLYVDCVFEGRRKLRAILDSGVSGCVYLPQSLKDCIQGAKIDFECGGMQITRAPAVVSPIVEPVISLDLLAQQTEYKRITLDFFQRRMFLEKSR